MISEQLFKELEELYLQQKYILLEKRIRSIFSDIPLSLSYYSKNEIYENKLFELLLIFCNEEDFSNSKVGFNLLLKENINNYGKLGLLLNKNYYSVYNNKENFLLYFIQNTILWEELAQKIIIKILSYGEHIDLHKSSEINFLFEVIKKDWVEVFKYFLVNEQTITNNLLYIKDQENSNFLLISSKNSSNKILTFILENKFEDLLAKNTNILDEKNSKNETFLLHINKTNLELFNKYKTKALFSFISLGEILKIKEYIEKGIDINTVNENGDTLLHLLIQNIGKHQNWHRFAEIFEFLLQNNINIFHKNNDGKNILMLCNDEGWMEIILEFFSRTILQADNNSIEYIVPLKQINQKEDTELWLWYIEGGNDNIAIKLINDKDNLGNTAFMLTGAVCMYSKYKKYINLEETNTQGETALLIAIKNGDHSKVRYLLNIGASTDYINDNKIMSFINQSCDAADIYLDEVDLGYFYGNNKDISTIDRLIRLCEINHDMDDLFETIRDNPSIIHEKNNDGKNILMLLCEKEIKHNIKDVILKIIRDNPSIIHEKNNDGKNILMLLCEKEIKSKDELTYIQLISLHLLKEKINVNAIDNNGNTALHLSIINNEHHQYKYLSELISIFLIENLKINWKIKNKNGNNALDLSYGSGNTKDNYHRLYCFLSNIKEQSNFYKSNPILNDEHTL